MLNVFTLNWNIKLRKFQNWGTVTAIYRISTLPGEYKQAKENKTIMQRKWKSNVFNSDGQNYKLFSYNILAQDLLVEHLHLYHEIDNKLLRWENRLNKLKEEIVILQPDILCLQEMQYDHLKDLVHQLNTANPNVKLEYVFKKKTGIRSDGCVIIYNRNKLVLISEQNVEYYTDDVPTLNRENIAIMVKFQSHEDLSSTFVVATTHLLYNPKREDVRISQVNKLIREIIDFSNVNHSTRLPVILTGDFNFTPDSHAFRILTDIRTNINSEVNQDATAEDLFQMEPIDFGNDVASTYQNKWVTVDYILKSRSKKDLKSIRVNSTYKLPSIDQCWKTGKTPNKLVGSDHFSLGVQFSIL